MLDYGKAMPRIARLVLMTKFVHADMAMISVFFGVCVDCEDVARPC